MKRQLLRLLALLALCTAALQLTFVLRVALMRVVDPQSTTFQRSEAWRLLTEQHRIAWAQQWVPAERLGTALPRAVIASEDAGFASHGGVDWQAVRGAWTRNQRAQARAGARAGTNAAAAASASASASAKIVGGSTITQQLAKNLLLSGERTTLRKAQELLITLALEGLLPKRRILEIYLNNVEWGEGVFGAEAAAHHYAHVDAKRLSAAQAARLAVMLPAPKRFEGRPASPYIASRAGSIAARMNAVDLP